MFLSTKTDTCTTVMCVQNKIMDKVGIFFFCVHLFNSEAPNHICIMFQKKLGGTIFDL